MSTRSKRPRQKKEPEAPTRLLMGHWVPDNAWVREKLDAVNAAEEHGDWDEVRRLNGELQTWAMTFPRRTGA